MRVGTASSRREFRLVLTTMERVTQDAPHDDTRV